VESEKENDMKTFPPPSAICAYFTGFSLRRFRGFHLAAVVFFERVKA
jgi:hypothetical protein